MTDSLTLLIAFDDERARRLSFTLRIEALNMPAFNHGSPFYVALERALKQRGKSIDDLCPPDDAIARRVLHDYGAMFVASSKVTPPPVCSFQSEDAVSQFQKSAG